MVGHFGLSGFLYYLVADSCAKVNDLKSCPSASITVARSESCFFESFCLPLLGISLSLLTLCLSIAPNIEEMQNGRFEKNSS
jgi:hypothetical protein